jgi:hypothetical protein
METDFVSCELKIKKRRFVRITYFCRLDVLLRPFVDRCEIVGLNNGGGEVMK